MTVTYEAAFANAMADAALALIDNGSTGSGAYGMFETSGDAEVASIQFSDPSGTVTWRYFGLGCNPSTRRYVSGRRNYRAFLCIR